MVKRRDVRTAPWSMVISSNHSARNIEAIVSTSTILAGCSGSSSAQSSSPDRRDKRLVFEGSLTPYLCRPQMSPSTLLKRTGVVRNRCFHVQQLP